MSEEKSLSTEPSLSLVPSLDPSLLPSAARSAWIEIDDGSLRQLTPLHVRETPEGIERWSSKRIREFQAGRHTAKLALAALGLPTPAIPRSADGVPLFPARVAASITHTGMRETFAAAAVLPGARGLGLDAENARALSPELTARVLAEGDAEALRAHGELTELALLVFSAKESFYKCIFPTTRSWLGFEDVSFELQETTEEDAKRRGSFRLRSLKAELQGGPLELSGRYFWTSERVITAVTWSDD